MRVGINGMGRIGRLTLRAALGGVARVEGDPRAANRLEVVHVNELKGGAAATAHLLEFDSIQGRWRAPIAADGDAIAIGSHRIGFSAAAHPRDVPWGELGCDVVLECTGKFLTRADLEAYLERGVQRVIVAAPVKDGSALNIVVGVNDDRYDGSQRLLTAASCTTNCLAPLVHVLLKEGFGIEEGLMTTVHSYTATQKTVDGPSKKDWKGGRSAAINIIPSTTGAAKAVALVCPEVKGKLTGMAFRVPTPTVSVVDLTVKTTKSTSYDEICAAMKKASETYLKGILAYTADEVCSTDFIHDAHSSIFDAGSGIQLNDRFFKLVSWYDNEWGYSNRCVELIEHIAKKL